MSPTTVKQCSNYAKVKAFEQGAQAVLDLPTDNM